MERFPNAARAVRIVSSVLFFNSMFGDPPELRPDGLPNEFELTADLRRFREASAVVFHLPTLSDIRRLRKPEGQLWIAWWMEARDHFPQSRIQLS